MLVFSLIGIFNRVIECLIHIYLIKIRAKIRLPKWDFVKDIIAIIYFTVIGNRHLYNCTPIIGFEILLVIHFYLNARKYYNYFKMTQFDLIFKYQFKIIDIMINLLIMAHFIVISAYNIVIIPICLLKIWSNKKLGESYKHPRWKLFSEVYIFFLFLHNKYFDHWIWRYFT